MGTAVALGEARRVEGYALAGAVPVVAEDPAAVRAAWAALGEDTTLVILTPAAATALGDAVPASGHPLTVVLPP